MGEEEFRIAIEIERLRGAVSEGFATVNGRLEGTLLRATTTEARLEKLETRCSLLERKVWMAAGASAAAGAAGAAGFLQIFA